MLLQINHSGLSDADLVNSPERGVMIALQGYRHDNRNYAVCTLQKQTAKPETSKMYLDHVPFFKLIKNLQSFYSASSA